MSTREIVDLTSDDESEKAGPVTAKLGTDFVTGTKQQIETHNGRLAKHKPSRATRQDSEENRSSNCPSTGNSNSSVLEQGLSPIDDTGISYASSICAAPLCRQFWKVGNYDIGPRSTVTVQSNPI